MFARPGVSKLALLAHMAGAERGELHDALRLANGQAYIEATRGAMVLSM